MRYLLLLAGFVAQAVSADYFVSTGGSDTNAGTSTTSPWRTIAKVNSRNLTAGDRVFFQGGQTFTDDTLTFTVNDTGTAANPIVVGSYGTGKAILKPNADVRGIFIYNTAGLRIQDLILEGRGLSTSTQTGLETYCDFSDGRRVAGLTARNLEVRGWRDGIMIGAWHASYSGFQDVLIENCLAHTCRRGGISSYGYVPSSATNQSHRNIIVRNCEVHGVTGDPLVTNHHSGSGIIISGTKGGLIDRCYAHHNGGSAGNSSGGGPVGIWTYASDSVTIQHCLVHDQKTTPGVKDGGGFDIDGGATNALIQYCYSYNNEGPGYLVCEYSGASPLADATIRYCISWNDGRRKANGMASGFHFWSAYGSDATKLTRVSIHNNLVYANATVAGPIVHNQGGAMNNIRFANNIFVTTGGPRMTLIAGNEAGFSFVNNTYFATDGNYNGGWRWGATTYTSLAAWRGATGSPETWAGAPVGFQIDPRLVNVTAGAQPTSIAAMGSMSAFLLLEDSPMTNRGVDLRTTAFGSKNVGSRDFFGTSIPQGPAFDIGVHERLASVTTTNAAPTISAISNQTIAEDTATAAIAFTIGDAETAAGSLVLSHTSSNTALVPMANIAFGGSGTSRTVTVRPVANGNGSATITITVADANGATASRSYLVNVTAVNDAPVNTALPSSSGTLVVGQIQTTTTGSWNDTRDTAWSGASTIGHAYQWLRADSNTGTNTVSIADATGSTYALTSSDAGKYVCVRVTATDTGVGSPSTQSTQVYSAWRGPIASEPISTNPLPSGWAAQDIGSVGAVGSTSVSNGTWTQSGSGADIWGSSDAFRFAWQSVSGDCTVTARVVSQDDTDTWAKAGVMIRASTASNAAHAMVVTTPTGVHFQHRVSTGNWSAGTSGGSQAKPHWVRLVRSGSIVAGYNSADGSTWTKIGEATIAMGDTALIGLAVTSHKAGTLSSAIFTDVSITKPTINQPPTVALTAPLHGSSATATASLNLTANASDSDGTITKVEFFNGATRLGEDATAPYTFTWDSVPAGTYSLAARAFDNAGASSVSTAVTVIVNAPAQEGLPAGWTAQDIGSGAAGSTTVSGGTWTLAGSGWDIWGTNDNFRYVWRTVDGDCVITARVTSQQNTDIWAKAGVMIREQLIPGSRHASLFVTPSKGVHLQWRTVAHSSSSSLAGSTAAAPRWVRLERVGSMISAYESADGATWTRVGSVTLAMGATIHIGLAATSSHTGFAAGGTFTDVQVVTTPAGAG